MHTRSQAGFVRTCVLVVALFCLATSPVRGQIQWTYIYDDPVGSGFNSTATAGSTTLGQLRRDSVVEATNYLSRMLDGRGTVRLNFQVSFSSAGSGTLAQFGSGGYVVRNGTFQNGAVYQRARNDGDPFNLTADAQGQFNMGKSWHYAVTGTNTTLSSSTLDFVSVLVHEIGHSLGFSALSAETAATVGIGLNNQTLGNPDLYGMFDKYLQRGNTVGSGGMFATNIAQATYGSFNTAVTTSAYTGGNTQTGAGTSVTNDATNGLYFNGNFAREIFGGMVPIYSPTTFADGSSGSHVNVGPTGIGVMNFSIGNNTSRRFQPYEIGMLLDLGWNVYFWNRTTGNFLDGVSNLATSRWRTDSGIVLSLDQQTRYNTFANPNQAPVLPVYGQTTANIVLNFNGIGTESYTATNDIGSVRLARLQLNSSSSNNITLAGGTLNFGANNDASPSVLIPKILQQNSGQFTISSAIQVNSLITQIVEGVTFTGHSALVIEGTGTGQVTISGNITGSGGIVMNGSFTTILSGTNGYAGSTTISSGVLAINGNHSTASGAVAVNGGKLTGVGTIASTVTVASGATLEAGTAIGTLTINANTTINTGGILRAELGSPGTADKVAMNGGSFTLDLRSGSVVNPQANGFTRSTSPFVIADLSGTGASLLQLNGTNVPISSTITTFVSTGGNAGNTTNNLGNVGMTLSGFSLVSGDSFVLSRDSSGDLVLAFTPVPEPLTVLSFGAIGLFAFRRLRR